MTDNPEVTIDDGSAVCRISNVRPVELCGDIEAGMDLSGAVVVGEHLVLGADEGHRLQFLQRDNRPDCWRLRQSLALAKQDQETDIEAIDYGDGHLYVVGSHSARRRRLKPELSVRRNRERMLQVEEEPSRNRLYRLPFDPASGEVGSPDSISLAKRLRKDPLLKRFYGLPSKENGIDIEGMAFRDGLLFLGFRGPVLRGNFVPVMVLSFDHPKEYTLRFVGLDGQGIRDMAALEDGFLILSGPVNDAPGPFCLWWWDGEDQVPGKDHPVDPARLLDTVSSPGGAKAEGLALLGRDGDSAEILIVYETGTAAQAVCMRIALGE